MFTAMLEMMKQGYLRAFQSDETGEILVAFQGSEEVGAEEILRGDHQGFDEDGDAEPISAPNALPESISLPPDSRPGDSSQPEG